MSSSQIVEYYLSMQDVTFKSKETIFVKLSFALSSGQVEECLYK